MLLVRTVCEDSCFFPLFFSLSLSLFCWKKKKKKIRYLQHSQMSQSCKIRLGDFSEVVRIEIPGQRGEKKRRDS